MCIYENNYYLSPFKKERYMAKNNCMLVVISLYSKPNKGVFVAYNKVVMAWTAQ